LFSSSVGWRNYIQNWQFWSEGSDFKGQGSIAKIRENVTFFWQQWKFSMDIQFGLQNF